MTPYEDHPSLSQEVNNRLHESELADGIWWKDVEPGNRALVRTKSRVYTIEKYDDETRISGHPLYCPKPVKAFIHGSTWGDSMIKIGWIGVGMRLEFSTVDHPEDITTTMVQNVVLEPIR